MQRTFSQLLARKRAGEMGEKSERVKKYKLDVTR